MNITDHSYILKHAARYAQGNTDSLYRIASSTDCLGAILNPDGTLTPEQTEKVRSFLKVILCLFENDALQPFLAEEDRQNIAIATNYFIQEASRN